MISTLARRSAFPWVTLYMVIASAAMLVLQIALTLFYHQPIVSQAAIHYAPLLPLWPNIVLLTLGGELANLPQAMLGAICYVFQHSSFMHFIFNMLFLLMLGPLLEARLGARRTLIFYFTVGIGSAIIHSLLTPVPQIPVVGISGVVFGIIAALLLIESNRLLLSLPAGFCLRVYHVALPVLAVQFYSFMAGPGVSGGDRTAYQLHFGGVLIGLVFALFQPPSSK